MPSPSRITKISSSARVAVLGARELAGRHLDVLQAGRDRARSAAEIAPRALELAVAPRVGLDGVEIHDRRGTRARLGERRRPGGGLGVELRRVAVVVAGRALDDPVADPREARAREARRLVLVAPPEREHVEVLERVQRVRDLGGAVDDAVARRRSRTSRRPATRGRARRGRRRSPPRARARAPGSTSRRRALRFASRRHRRSRPPRRGTSTFPAGGRARASASRPRPSARSPRVRTIRRGRARSRPPRRRA